MLNALIEDLVKAGLTEQEIAAAIGRNQSSVNRMRRGKQRTDYETGLKLEKLHRERCPETTPPAAGEQGRAAA